jgi:hypothetical protein
MKNIIVETQQELSWLQGLAKTERFLLFPFFGEDKHPLLSSPIVVFAKPLTKDELYIISISHCECIDIPFDFSVFNKPFVYNKKYFDLPGSVDMESVYYVQNKECPSELDKHREDWQNYPIYRIIDIISSDILKYAEECRKFTDEEGKPFKFINEITLPLLKRMD